MLPVEEIIPAVLIFPPLKFPLADILFAVKFPVYVVR